jgi:hypothetical protein
MQASEQQKERKGEKRFFYLVKEAGEGGRRIGSRE